jgi:pimeloyl-ACP methyl ester carboxylesterase
MRALVLVATLTTGAVVGAVPAPAGAATRTKLSWTDCGSSDRTQCARLTVPLDYSKPRGRTIKLALEVNRTAKSSERVGYVVVNPGGPGASGLEMVDHASLYFPKKFLDQFDVVGWDPRGVGKSAPVECQRDLDSVFHVDYSPDTRAEQKKVEAVNKATVKQCVKHSHGVLPYVSSKNTARDMDRIRAALGERKLTYVGYSYGTYLGTLYADLFPKRVRALVLDGAIDPALSAATTAEQQGAGLDKALDGFFAECAANRSCAFYNDGHPAQAYDALAKSIDARPIDAGHGRRLGPGEFDIGVATTLYSGTQGWQYLASALADAQKGDGSALMDFSDSYVGRSSNGTYDNSQPAFWAIGCLDTPTIPRGSAGFEKTARAAATVAPHFGASTVYLGIICAYWPYGPVSRTGPIHAPGAPPILVVGTLDDPITPASWAQGLAKELDSGHLLLTQGEGHAAFGRLNDCVDEHVIDYLVNLTLPPAGLVCS